MEFTKSLFEVSPIGCRVVIAGGSEDPIKRPAAGVLSPTMAGVTKMQAMPLSPDGKITWNPTAAPTGHVSIIISTKDQQVVVLREGIEIGRAHAVVATQTDQPQVMTLT